MKGILLIVALLCLVGTASATVPVQSNIENRTAMASTVWINWTTDIITNNTIEYSTSSDLSGSSYSYYDNSTDTPQIKLWRLEPTTTYYYSVWSYNASDNVNSSIYNFTTPAAQPSITVTTGNSSQSGIDYPLQEAVDNVATNGTITIGSGTFELTSKTTTDSFITASSNLKGPSNILIYYKSNITMAGAGDTTHFNFTTALANGIMINAADNITIRDLNTTSISNDATADLIMTIHVHNSSDATLLNITATNGPRVVLGATHAAQRIIIKNCTTYYGNEGILIGRIGGADYSFDNIYIEENTITMGGGGAYGIKLDGLGYVSSGMGRYVRNNTVYNGVEGIRIYSGSVNTTASDNKIYDSRDVGISLILDIKYAIVSNNYIQGVHGSAYSHGGISLYGDNTDLNNTIENNIIVNCVQSGIVIYQYGALSFPKNTNINNNVVYNSSHDGIYVSQYPNNTNIKNNIIINSGRYGINSYTSDINISFNDIYNSVSSDLNGSTPGIENISVDPLFYNISAFNFHLNSTNGTWNDVFWENMGDDSPCIDTGDPAFDYILEPYMNGSRINMGAYGNTIYASKSGGGWTAGENIFVGYMVRISDAGNITQLGSPSQESINLTELMGVVLI